MNKIYIDEIIKATGGTLTGRGSMGYITGVKHDSRECGPGDMFVAIWGENRDGHEYIPQVIENGCGTVMVSHEDGWPDMCPKGTEINIIKTEDTVLAMGKLAKYYLSTLDVLKVAVTGSVGKTSTRDMIYYALSERYDCGRNIKNFNNNIGLPLSIFGFDDSMDAVVLEMGMDHAGEIDALAGIVEPDIAVITNIGISHLENFESRDGIFDAKMEVTRHITGRNGSDGALVFPFDGEYLTRERTAGAYRQIVIGDENARGECDYMISDIEDFGVEGIEFTLKHGNERNRVTVPVPGGHNAVNASLAIAVGGLAGIPAREAAAGISKTELTGRRLKFLKGDSISVIDDTYNASPDSMKSALTVLKRSACGGKRVAILGDMYELGAESGRKHFEVGAFAKDLGLDALITAGERAKQIADGARGGDMKVICFETKEELLENLNELVGDGDLILVKGSRGMKMESVVEKILNI